MVTLCSGTMHISGIKRPREKKKSKNSVSQRTTNSEKTNYLQACVLCFSAFGRDCVIVVVVEVVIELVVVVVMVVIMTLSSVKRWNLFKLCYYLFTHYIIITIGVCNN